MITWAKSSTANERLFYSQILPKVIPREVNTSIGDGNGWPSPLGRTMGIPDYHRHLPTDHATHDSSNGHVRSDCIRR